MANFSIILKITMFIKNIIIKIILYFYFYNYHFYYCKIFIYIKWIYISSLILIEAYKRKYIPNSFIIVFIIYYILFSKFILEMDSIWRKFSRINIFPFTNLVGIDNFKSMLMNHGMKTILLVIFLTIKKSLKL